MLMTFFCVIFQQILLALQRVDHYPSVLRLSDSTFLLLHFLDLKLTGVFIEQHSLALISYDRS